jgi:hypothetical protein
MLLMKMVKKLVNLVGVLIVEKQLIFTVKIKEFLFVLIHVKDKIWNLLNGRKGYLM